MRVFYPISVRVSEIINNEAHEPTGGRMIWSVICLTLLALVLSALSTFEIGASREPNFFSIHQLSHANSTVHSNNDEEKHKVKASSEPADTKLRVSMQEYVNAHRYARYSTSIKPAVAHTGRLNRPKINDRLYL